MSGNLSQADVIIVGGSVAGLQLANSLSKRFSVILVETRKSYTYSGYRVMSIEAFKKWGFPEELAEGKIYTTRVYSPSLKYHVDTKFRLRGIVVDKGRIERYLLSTLPDSVELILGDPVVKVNVGDKAVILKSGKILKYSKWLIGADGAFSKTRKLVNSSDIQIVNCVTHIYENKDLLEVPIVVFSKLTPDFYGWIIPTDTILEIGVGSANVNTLYDTLQKFISKLVKNQVISISASPVMKSGGPIPITYVEKVAKDSIFLVGDSTGGEPLLGGSLHKVILEHDLLIKSLETLSPILTYQNAWETNILPELEHQLVLRRELYSSLDNLENIIRRYHGAQMESSGLINGVIKKIVTEIQ